jgi:hypothetical protein
MDDNPRHLGRDGHDSAMGLPVGVGVLRCRTNRRRVGAIALASMPTPRDEFAFDESPCDLCALAARCRAHLEACEQFRMFVLYGGRGWRKDGREPSAEIYADIYRDASGNAQLAAA